MAAGTLYEYKVGAVLDCGTDSQGNVQIQEFFTAPPYDIGFRTNIGLASGEVLFENGSPSDSVYVVVEPQGTMNARNAIVFPEDTYLKMTIPPSSERSSVWPDINSHEAAAEWSVSEWIKVPSTTMTNNAGPEFTGVPILGFNAVTQKHRMFRSLHLCHRQIGHHLSIDHASSGYGLLVRRDGPKT